MNTQNNYSSFLSDAAATQLGSIAVLDTNPDTNLNEQEFIQGLICCRRYDRILQNVNMFSKITLESLNSIQILDGVTLIDLLFKEAPKSTLSLIISIRESQGFNGETLVTNTKIANYLLEQLEKGTSDANSSNILHCILALTKTFQDNENTNVLCDLLIKYITLENIHKFVNLIKFITFADGANEWNDSVNKTILFNNPVYENNILIKLITRIDLDNDNELNRSIKLIIDYILQDPSIVVNLLDKNGNTLLANCMTQYSVKKIMYLISLGCDPCIINPLSGENLINETKIQTDKLKKDNNKDTIYYYYKTVRSYFKMHNFKTTLNKQKMLNGPKTTNNNAKLPSAPKQSSFGWFQTYCK